MGEQGWNMDKFKIIFCDKSITGKSLSEALIFASTNLQYDDRLFIYDEFSTWKLQAQNMLRTWSEHVVYINCSECQNKNNNVCTQHVLQVFWAYNFMNNEQSVVIL